MVDGIVAEACDNYIALTMDEDVGNDHIIVRRGTIHASTATTWDRIVEEIRAVAMPRSARARWKRLATRISVSRYKWHAMRRESFKPPSSSGTRNYRQRRETGGSPASLRSRRRGMRLV
jgi:hypothetical protein